MPKRRIAKVGKSFRRITPLNNALPPEADADGQPDDQRTGRRRNNPTGILWMLVATLCLASMHSIIHHISDTVHPFVTVFFRLFFALIVVVPFFVKAGPSPLRTGRLGMLTLRGILNFGAMLCYFAALSLSPLADVTALSFTAPLFASVLAVVILKERIGWRRVSAIIAGFVGTLVILRPGFTDISSGYALVLISTLFWGACVIIIRDLGRTESAATITTYMSLIMAPMALLPALFVWSWPSPADWGWLIALGLIGGCGQLAMSQSLKNAETHVVMPFDFTRLIWVSISGFIFFGEVPDAFVWLGGALIFSSAAYITIREHRRKVPRESSGTTPISR